MSSRQRQWYLHPHLDVCLTTKPGVVVYPSARSLEAILSLQNWGGGRRWYMEQREFQYIDLDPIWSYRSQGGITESKWDWDLQTCHRTRGNRYVYIRWTYFTTASHESADGYSKFYRLSNRELLGIEFLLSGACRESHVHSGKELDKPQRLTERGQPPYHTHAL